MKKFTLLFSVTLLVIIGFRQITFAQAQRLVLVEEFTQASCPPCASQNPAFDDLLLSNTDKVVTLKYHTSWPGVDPMNAQQPSDVQTRVTYYNITGVPMSAMDGFVWPDYDGFGGQLGAEYRGAPYQCTQGLIDSMYAIGTPFNLTSTYWLSQNLDSIYATVTVTAVGSYSGSLIGQVAVIEKVVDFDAPPGTNGELQFDAVMKKMLPNANGTSLASSWIAGDTYTYTVGWKLSNIYDMNQIAVVAFIQNNTSKEVLQSTYSAPQQLSNYGVVTSLSVPVMQCTNLADISVGVENYGTQNLTSATVEYKIDGGASQDLNWSGNLASGATATVALPEITFNPGSHTVEAYVTSANGGINPSALINDQLKKVIVLSIPGGTTPIAQNFTSATFPPSSWFLSSADPANNWTRVSNVGGYQTGLGSAKYDFFDIPLGAIGELYVQNFDLSATSNSTLTFDIAKCMLTGYTYNDELQIAASKDCGATWSVLYDKDDNSGLNTFQSPAFTAWKPTAASQWRTDNVDLSSFSGNDNVIVKFVGISGYGNNLFIDNINLTANVGIENVGKNEISIYPNPANTEAVVHVNGTVPNQTMLEVVNVLGQRIYSVPAKSNSDLTINTSKFETGMYIYRLNDSGKIVAQDKFNVTH